MSLHYDLMSGDCELSTAKLRVLLHYKGTTRALRCWIYAELLRRKHAGVRR